MRIPFIDLHSQYREIKKEAGSGFRALMARGDFILGRDVKDFERTFSRYIGTEYALGVNSGTDALFFGLLSLGVGPGDEVIVPVFTYIASAFAVSYAGAKPVFVDIDEDTYNLDPLKIEKAITRKTKAIMPVHLYGQAADMGPILRLAKQHRLKVIEDAAQAHGTEYKGKKVGTFGHVSGFSFYPTKNLGGFGDGGMIVTNEKILFDKLVKLRDYGRRSKYEHLSLGYNSRLDSLQAIFLKEKLKRLDAWNKKRVAAAHYYKKLLKSSPDIILPCEAQYGKHIYHIFAIRVMHRDKVLEGLNKAGISASVYYPIPLHLQPVYKYLGYKEGDFPVAERACKEVIALPIYPHIKKGQIEYVVKTLKWLVNNG